MRNIIVSENLFVKTFVLQDSLVEFYKVVIPPAAELINEAKKTRGYMDNPLLLGKYLAACVRYCSLGAFPLSFSSRIAKKRRI